LTNELIWRNANNFTYQGNNNDSSSLSSSLTDNYSKSNISQNYNPIEQLYSTNQVNSTSKEIPLTINNFSQSSNLEPSRLPMTFQRRNNIQTAPAAINSFYGHTMTPVFQPSLLAPYPTYYQVEQPGTILVNNTIPSMSVRSRYPVIAPQHASMYQPSFVGDQNWSMIPSTPLPPISDFYGVSSPAASGLNMFAVRPMLRPQQQVVKNTPTNKLTHAIEDAYDEYKNLEKERKKVEGELSKAFPGRRVVCPNNTPLPRPPANPSRVDKLIADQSREHGRVMALIDRMAHLLVGPMDSTVNDILEDHYQKIKEVEARRRDELSSHHSAPGSQLSDHDMERLVAALVVGLKLLTQATRRSRTALWAALQITLDSKSTNKVA